MRVQPLCAAVFVVDDLMCTRVTTACASIASIANDCCARGCKCLSPWPWFRTSLRHCCNSEAPVGSREETGWGLLWRPSQLSFPHRWPSLLLPLQQLLPKSLPVQSLGLWVCFPNPGLTPGLWGPLVDKWAPAINGPWCGRTSRYKLGMGHGMCSRSSGHQCHSNLGFHASFSWSHFGSIIHLPQAPSCPSLYHSWSQPLSFLCPVLGSDHPFCL